MRRAAVLFCSLCFVSGLIVGCATGPDSGRVAVKSGDVQVKIEFGEEDRSKIRHYYKKRFKTYREARLAALDNIVNRSDLYRPSNKFIDEFWGYLKKLY